MPDKTLEEAIGCWTTSDEGLRMHAKRIRIFVDVCARITRANGDPETLLRDLRTLKANIDSAGDTTNEAIRRCIAIIDTNEVVTPPVVRRRRRKAK